MLFLLSVCLFLIKTFEKTRNSYYILNQILIIIGKLANCHMEIHIYVMQYDQTFIKAVIVLCDLLSSPSPFLPPLTLPCLDIHVGQNILNGVVALLYLLHHFHTVVSL